MKYCERRKEVRKFRKPDTKRHSHHRPKGRKMRKETLFNNKGGNN